MKDYITTEQMNILKNKGVDISDAKNITYGNENTKEYFHSYSLGDLIDKLPEYVCPITTVLEIDKEKILGLYFYVKEKGYLDILCARDFYNLGIPILHLIKKIIEENPKKDIKISQVTTMVNKGKITFEIVEDALDFMSITGYLIQRRADYIKLENIYKLIIEKERIMYSHLGEVSKMKKFESPEMIDSLFDAYIWVLDNTLIKR